MRRRSPRTLPPVLATWPGWAAPAALGALWAGGLVAAVVVLATLAGTDPAAVKLAAALLAGATTAGLLVWLARGTGECSAARFGIAPAAPRRAVAGAGLVALAVAAACGLLALLGLFGAVGVPPEFWRVGRLAAPPRAVPLDPAALASLLARAVIAPLMLEVVVRGVLLPALARVAGPWPAIGLSAVAGAAAWGGLAGDARLLLPALLLGVLLGPLFVATGSIVPGTGVASALAGAAVALQCGWGAPAAVLAGGSAAALAVAALLALAGRAAPLAEPAPLPRAAALARESGQAAAETMGILLIVAAIVAALFASGISTEIVRQTHLLICRIAGGDCRALETAVDPECMVSRTINTGGMAVTVAVVKVGEENTLIKQVYADGRTVFTLIENGSVAAELIAGAKAKGGNIGFDATASVSAGGRLEGARTYTFTDSKKAAEFEAMVREHGSFGQVLRNAAEGWDPLGVKDWTLDHVFGDDVDMEDLPEPDSTYLGVDALVKGEAAAIGNVILADAGASALLQQSGGARLYTSGPQKGTVELNMKLDGELAGQLGLATFGPNIEGKANFTVRVTLDPKNGYRPSHMRVIATAGYNGDLSDSDFRLNPTTGQLDQLQEALKKGKLLDSGSLATTDGTGSQIEFTADLDLKDDTARAEAVSILTGSLPAALAAGDLARRVDEQGRLTFQSYDTSMSNTEGGLVVGLGVGGGVEGSQSSESRDLGSAWVREPGGTWQVRNCGPR